MIDSAKLRELRDRRKLTQQQLADRAGVDRVTIARLETGGRSDPPLSVVVALSKALRCKMECFV